MDKEEKSDTGENGEKKNNGRMRESKKKKQKE